MPGQRGGDGEVPRAHALRGGIAGRTPNQSSANDTPTTSAQATSHKRGVAGRRGGQQRHWEKTRPNRDAADAGNRTLMQ
jgi:hypothetical protein